MRRLLPVIALVVLSSCLNINQEEARTGYDDSGEYAGAPTQDPAEAFPILMLDVPEFASNTEPFSIKGLGFDESQSLFLVAADGTRLPLEFALSATGISCDIPLTVPTGIYDLVLYVSRYDRYWTLAQGLSVIVKTGLTGIIFTNSVVYDYDAVPGEELEEFATAQGMGVSELMELLRSAGLENGSSVSGYMIYKDAEGYVSRITSVLDGDEVPAYTFSWEDAHTVLTAVNERFESGYDMVKEYRWELEGERVVRMVETTENRAVPYDIDYDEYGHIIGQTMQSGVQYTSFSYDRNDCFTGLNGYTFFSYSKPYVEINPASINIPVALLDGLYHYSFSASDSDWLPVLNMVGLGGKGSRYAPSRLMDPSVMKAFNVDYEIDGDGYVQSASWRTEGLDPLLNLIPSTTTTTVSFIYN